MAANANNDCIGGCGLRSRPPPSRQKLFAADLGKRTAELGRKRTEAIAATGTVAGFAGLLKRSRGYANPRSTDCLRSALKPVCRRGQTDQIASAPSCIDRPLGCDRAGAER
jgi:hypothetical protein